MAPKILLYFLQVLSFFTIVIPANPILDSPYPDFDELRCTTRDAPTARETRRFLNSFAKDVNQNCSVPYDWLKRYGNPEDKTVGLIAHNMIFEKKENIQISCRTILEAAHSIYERCRAQLKNDDVAGCTIIDNQISLSLVGRNIIEDMDLHDGWTMSLCAKLEYGTRYI